MCVATAVATVKVGRPVHLKLERQTDMCITGQRHPFKILYKVGFTNDGYFSALDVQIWSNGGCSTDLSAEVLDTAIINIENCYRFPNIRIRGRACKTHLPSNTGLISIEKNLMKEISFFLK